MKKGLKLLLSLATVFMVSGTVTACNVDKRTPEEKVQEAYDSLVYSGLNAVTSDIELITSVADLEDVEESIKDHVSTNKQNLTTDLIIDCVCKYYSISKEDLLGKKKNKEIVEPRQICMYIMCDLLDLPLTSVGEIFGKKDHTTVMHARDKITDLIKENNRIRVIVQDIEDMANRK